MTMSLASAYAAYHRLTETYLAWSVATGGDAVPHRSHSRIMVKSLTTGGEAAAQAIAGGRSSTLQQWIFIGSNQSKQSPMATPIVSAQPEYSDESSQQLSKLETPALGGGLSEAGTAKIRQHRARWFSGGNKRSRQLRSR